MKKEKFHSFRNYCNNKLKQLGMHKKKNISVKSGAKLPPLKEAGLGQDVWFMCVETKH